MSCFTKANLVLQAAIKSLKTKYIYKKDSNNQK